ncbi:hypothetical protein [Nocardia sp. NPDC023988]
MGSTDALSWLREGYLAGDPLRSALFSAIALPILIMGSLSGQPF